MIIEVDGGRYETLKIVTQSVRDKGVPHPVLWDRDCQNTERYGISAWPIAYLIGPDGKVAWEGNPARTIRRQAKRIPLELTLQQLLKQSSDTTSATD